MANKNCLVGLKCRSCGSEGPFGIQSTCWVEWTDEGTNDPTNFEFEDDAAASCFECDASGTVGTLLRGKA